MTRTLATLLVTVSCVFAQSPAPSHTPGTSDSDYRAGYTAAELDIKRGIVRYFAIGGPPTRDWSKLVQRAKKLYQVELLATGCVATPYEHGYSDAVIRHLSQRYGHDPILALHKQLTKEAGGE